MTTQKHSPGPFKIHSMPSKDGPAYPYEVCILSNDNIRLATMENWKGEPAQSEADANAALFVAAPELLEALQAMVDMMDSGDEPGKGSPWHTQARAAITKANP